MDHAPIAALYRYTSWANGRVLEAVSRLTRADFTRDVKSSFGSIRDTLTHVVWAEWIWLQRWKGVSPAVVFAPADFPSVASLRERFQVVDAERSDFLADLTSERLIQVVEYTNLNGEIWRYPLWQQLHHAVNHSTYHRGQVAGTLRQLGAVPPPTDLLAYYDEGGR